MSDKIKKLLLEFDKAIQKMKDAADKLEEIAKYKI